MARSSKTKADYVSPETRVRICGDNKSYLFGKAVYQPGGRCGPRVQRVFQLIVMIRGSLRVTVNDAVHDLSPGDAILLHPGSREFFRFSAEAESIHTWCEVAPGHLSPADRRHLRRAPGVYQAPSSIHLLIEEGLSVQDHNNAELHYAGAALARACLLRFATDVSSRDNRRLAAALHPALSRALDMAAANYAELHSASDLARRVGISANQLRALCRQARVESPSALIWRLKVEHAIQLIRSTGLTLGEIAADCGYANPFHLSRSVRRHTGCSPRRLQQGEWER